MDIALICFSFKKFLFTKDAILEIINQVGIITGVPIHNTKIQQTTTHNIIEESNIKDFNLLDISVLRVMIVEDIFLTIGFIQNDYPNYISIQFEKNYGQLPKSRIIDMSVFVYQILGCCFGIAGELITIDSPELYDRFRINIEAFRWPKSYSSRISNISSVLLLSEQHLKSARISNAILCKFDKLIIREINNSDLLISIGEDFSVDDNIDEYKALDNLLSSININNIIESFSTLTANINENGEENESDSQIQKVKEEIYQLQNKLSVSHQLSVFQKHVLEFDAEYLAQDKLPRNHVYRPYRFCSQDIVLGLTVVKHLIDRNALEVDVCLISEIPEYEQYSSTRMMLSFLLTEAFKCGGTLEIFFTNNVFGGTVPPDIMEYAKYLNVTLNHVSEGMLTSHESVELFLEMAGFSDNVKNRIVELSSNGILSPTRVCYAINKGLWTMPEMESLLLGCPDPGGIFRGDSPVDIRHLFTQDIAYSKAAVLGGYLDRALLRRDTVTGSTATELEDDVNLVSIEFNEQYFAKIYTCEEPIEIPWIVNSDEITTLDINRRLIVLVRPRETAELEMFMQNDLQCAVNAKEQLITSSQDIIAILVPYEFEDIAESIKNELVHTASRQGIYIMSSKETNSSLNTEALNRIKSAKVLRQ